MNEHKARWSLPPFGDRSLSFHPDAKEEVRLKPLRSIRYNPGNLRAFAYVPEKLLEPAPLVVVLHGCTQSAADYDRGSGWSRLADRHGFALLFPEQKGANNGGGCFNWFRVGDSQRGMGEPASIRAMVDAMGAAWQIDNRRIFITGLSAGGAMASVMLATYPDVFPAGAIIAGVAYGCASDVREAFDCMGGHAQAEPDELADRVRRASPHKGPWPRVSIWQGSADDTVAPSNADALVQQWTGLHGLPVAPSRVGRIEGYPHNIWLDGKGRTVIERYDITGMAHGTPLMPGVGIGQSGEAGAHMLDADISSTDRIAAFFGIAPKPAQRRKKRAPKPAQKLEAALTPPDPWEYFPGSVPSLKEARQAFDDALKAAGVRK